MILEKVTKSYGGLPVVADFSLTLPQKGCLCLFGPSGCGKTTLLHLMAGITEPDEGTVTPGGAVSVAFQEDRLLPWLSALQNIMAAGVERGEALLALSKVGLSNVGQKRADLLSGGMKKRVSIARALSYPADIYLFDEPFSGIDALRKEGITALLWELSQKKPVVLVTHDAREAISLCDRVLILSGPPLKIARVFEIEEKREDRLTPKTQAKYLPLFDGPP